MVAKQSAWLSKLFRALGLGLPIGIGFTVLGSAVAAWMLNSGKLEEGSIGYATTILLLLSSASTAYSAVLYIKERRLLVCLLAGSAYLLSMLAITALFFGGTYKGVGESALVILAGVISVALIGRSNNKSLKGKRK